MLTNPDVVHDNTVIRVEGWGTGGGAGWHSDRFAIILI